MPFGRNWASPAAHAQPPVRLPRRGPPPRLLGALALLRSPDELDGEGLGRAATAAAREGLDDNAWWQAFIARAKELAPHLGLHDASLVLNGMARARRIDRSLVQALLPRMRSQLVYLTSAHLAMLSSAIAKAEVHDPAFVELLTREVKARLTEFHSAMELTMVINAVSKLRVSDDELYRRFVTHVQSQMSHEAFHVRDISVIVGALVRANCMDAATMTRFTDCALQTLPEATSMELAKLMHACMSASCGVHDFYSACVLRSREQVLTMDPTGLSSAAFAFGQCFEAAQVEHLPYLRKIFKGIRLASVAGLPLFLPQEIASLLRTYARWQISFNCGHLQKVADRMLATQKQFDVEGSVATLYSMALLMQRNSVRSTATSTVEAAWKAMEVTARTMLKPVWAATRRGDVDVVTLLRAVEAAAVLRAAGGPEAVAAVSACILRHRADLDGPACSSLYELLGQWGCSPRDDIMLVLLAGKTQDLLGS